MPARCQAGSALPGIWPLCDGPGIADAEIAIFPLGRELAQLVRALHPPSQGLAQGPRAQGCSAPISNWLRQMLIARPCKAAMLRSIGLPAATPTPDKDRAGPSTRDFPRVSFVPATRLKVREREPGGLADRPRPPARRGPWPPHR